MKHIDSATNPLVKTLRRLAHPRKREAQFLLEGRKLVEAAMTSGIHIDTIVVSSAYEAAKSPDETASIELAELPDALFRKLSTLDSPDGIIAVARRPASTMPSSGIVAVAAGIQDPGNLGAIARVVEASGATGLMVLKGSADPFGPKAVRGSMGSVVRVPVREASDMSELSGFRKAALVPRGGTDYTKVDWTPPLAVVFGAESAGIDDETLAQCESSISIPMRGAIDSLNVATAAALILYEATRRDD